MNPLAIALAIGIAIGSGSAWKLTADHYDAKAAKQQKADAAAYQARTVELNQVSADLEKARNDRKTVYRTITQQVDKVVTRDVYRNVCLDDDGVRSINSALAGTADTSEPTPAMPATPAAGR